MRLLLVEDEDKLGKAIKAGLEKEGYAVDLVADGGIADRRIETNGEYDAVILDVMLPGKDGMSICRDARKRGVATPILMLTARDTVGDRVTGLDAGADDYLVKPFDFAELCARLRALLRRPNETLPAKLVLGRLTLDPATRRVTHGGDEVILTRKEFSILEYFMRHPGQVLSRERILNHAWDFEFDSFSNVVDVHLKNLRKKLSDIPHAPAIETVRGSGYRITT